MAILSTLLAACAVERSENLGVRGRELAPCPASPNWVSSFATDARHYIAPLAFSGVPDNAFAALKTILKRRGDATIIDEQVDYMRAELRTTFFVDDAEFLLDRGNGVIQIRSASRLGYSDLGKNRSRMEEIRAQFARAGDTTE